MEGHPGQGDLRNRNISAIREFGKNAMPIEKSMIFSGNFHFSVKISDFFNAGNGYE
jgi:hypothetical protein